MSQGSDKRFRQTVIVQDIVSTHYKIVYMAATD